jgi:hypothetical protein
MNFSGHDPSNPINASQLSGQTPNITPTSPSVTTTVDSCLILRLGAFHNDNITAGSPGLSGHSPITMDKSAAAVTVAILGSWTSGTTHAKTAGTNRALVFTVHGEGASAVSVSGVTYGGQAMTKVVEAINSSGTTRVYTAAFILNEAGITAATTTTFTPTWVGTTTGTGYGSVLFQNVSQSTLTGASAGNSTTTGGTITTTALATAAGDMVVDAATNSTTGTYSVNNSFTKALELTITGADGVDGYKAATGASETPSATHTNTTNRQSLIGFVIQGPGKVSGGAGYVRQATAGNSGQSNFSLTASNEAQMLTIAIAPNSCACCDSQIRP